MPPKKTAPISFISGPPPAAHTPPADALITTTAAPLPPTTTVPSSFLTGPPPPSDTDNETEGVPDIVGEGVPDIEGEESVDSALERKDALEEVVLVEAPNPNPDLPVN